ncbi:MAG: phenylalanine--tRNA ligase subunit beta [Muribaculaceae bacterium]|nr:phenylalanine--tRNA ligase subunit beta [Muribaculaceae bacterium]
MNISYSWLKRYIDFDLTPNELADALTSLGLETGSVEKVESIKGGLKGLVAGKVLTCEAHPDSDHLHITTVDISNGAEDPLQIVCGAPNVASGQTVIVATLGTVLYDGDKEFLIKKSKIRGVESFGMLCAEDEIGVGHSHDGIIVLDDKTISSGTPAASIFNVHEDYVLEVDLTPNRIDAASHYGVARDLSAWLIQHGIKSNLHRPNIDRFEISRKEGKIEVEVENTKSAPRYSGIVIRGVKVGESPEWLKNLLLAIGQRPINSIVDITNYILFSICQPLHCFDLSKIKGDKIIVKNASEGDKFVTLDGVERTLNGNDLMICDSEKPLCIAGVFGGLDSGVTESTTDIFLESACFNPTSIRKTARRQGLNTDASFRYERGIDPNNTVYALKMAALLVKEIAGGEICTPLIDIYSEPAAPFSVELNYNYLNNIIGKEIPKETVKSIITSLDIAIVKETDDNLSLFVPAYRVDVQRPCDVAEEILRVYGYNNVEFSDSLKSSLSYKGATDTKNELQNLVSEQLTALGFNEILNNSLTAVDYYNTLETYPADRCVKLINPLSNDLSVMRQTLLFGGLESIAHNINRKRDNLSMYEFGNCYSYDSSIDATEKLLAPYSETSCMSILMTGSKSEGSWIEKERDITVFDLKAIVFNIFARLGIAENELAMKSIASDIYSNGIEFTTRGGKNIGTLGIVKNTILKKMDIDQPVYYCELDWNAIVKLSSKKKVSYTDLPKSQPVKRDLALLLDTTVTFGDVKRVIASAERRLLKEVTLFDVYEGKNLEAGKKSYAVSMILQDNEKTLQDKEIEKSMNKIITSLQKELGATLR